LRGGIKVSEAQASVGPQKPTQTARHFRQRGQGKKKNYLALPRRPGEILPQKELPLEIKCGGIGSQGQLQQLLLMGQNNHGAGFHGSATLVKEIKNKAMVGDWQTEEQTQKCQAWRQAMGQHWKNQWSWLVVAPGECSPVRIRVHSKHEEGGRTGANLRRKATLRTTSHLKRTSSSGGMLSPTTKEGGEPRDRKSQKSYYSRTGKCSGGRRSWGEGDAITRTPKKEGLVLNTSGSRGEHEKGHEKEKDEYQRHLPNGKNGFQRNCVLEQQIVSAARRVAGGWQRVVP